MAFDDLSLQELLSRELDLTGNVIAINQEIVGGRVEPVEFTFDLTPRKTKRGKRFPPHKWTTKLTSVDDFDKAWDEAVESFRRRFNKRKQWFTGDGTPISPKAHHQRVNNGITTDTMDMVERWNERAWNAIMVGLQPSSSDLNQVKQLEFGDFTKIQNLQEERRQNNNELQRVKSEIMRRQLHRKRIKTWKPQVTESFEEQELRKQSQRWLYARFGMKVADMDYVRRFKRGEIGLDEILKRVKTYQKLD